MFYTTSSEFSYIIHVGDIYYGHEMFLSNNPTVSDGPISWQYKTPIWKMKIGRTALNGSMKDKLPLSCTMI